MGSKFRFLWASFSGGEQSVLMDGRTDVERYYSGIELGENILVTPQGYATKRPGTHYVADAKSHAGPVRLIPFVFSDEDAFILEFGDEYIRFYTLGAQVLDAGAAYEVVSPYTEDQLDDIKFAQSADVMYFTHPNVQPYKLSRSGLTSWTMAAVSFTATPSEWTGTNYPRSIAFFERRLWLASTPDEPQTFWASQVGDYEDMTTGTGDTDALEFTIASGSMNKIQWLTPQLALVIGTYGEVFTAGARSALDILSPTNIKVDPETGLSCSGVQGLLIENAIIFCGRHARKIREYAYRGEQGYTGRDLTLLSAEITHPGITALEWAEDPHHLLWALKSDGTALAGAYYPGEDVVGWTRIITDGEIESLSVIPGEGYDQVWWAVKRQIGSNYYRFIERMDEGWTPGKAIADIHNVDCGLTYDGAATSVITGLDHLNGAEVQVMSDGADEGDFDVAGGSITIDSDGSKVHVGMGYTARGLTRKPEVATQQGTGLGGQVKAHNVCVKTHFTVKLKVGPSFDNLYDVPFRDRLDLMDTALPAFTGDVVAVIDGNWEAGGGQIAFYHDRPLPMTILSLGVQLEINDMVPGMTERKT